MDPMKNGDIPSSYVSLPDGNFCGSDLFSEAHQKPDGLLLYHFCYPCIAKRICSSSVLMRIVMG